MINRDAPRPPGDGGAGVGERQAGSLAKPNYRAASVPNKASTVEQFGRNAPTEHLTRDATEALDYLRWLRPEGPWVLTSIPPEGGVTETATFGPETEGELVSWIAKRDGRLNLYYMVNPPRGPLTSKAKKEHVDAMEFLHVDLDPRKPPKDMRDDELPAYNERERERILESLEGFEPRPSAVVDSGGGYQAFWRLEEAIYVGGDVALAEEAETYNQQLAVVLGGDNCHNIDRIMRLPGTVNVPDERKRKKGRQPRVASVVWADRLGEHVYPASKFTRAPRVQGAGAGAKVEISGNLQFLKNLDELPAQVSPRTRALIVQGDDPDDPTRYGSRSEIVWAVCCELVRAGCDDDMIAAVLLDPAFGIGDHVRDQKRSAEYAARQIQRAREEVENPILREFNEKHAVVADLGGKCRVITEQLDATHSPPRIRVSKQSFEDFRNRYMHIRVEVGQTRPDAGGNTKPIYAPAGKWWLSHPMRRQYETLVFAPGKEFQNAYNLWRGWGLDPEPGDWSLLKAHICDVLAAGDAKAANYILMWCAWTFQNPGAPAEVALVFRGGKGIGKGVFGRAMKSAFGQHGLQISSGRSLTGNFNAHLTDCALLVADEAFWPGDKEGEGTLKRIVTEPTLFIEPKGVDAFEVRNCLHIIMLANAEWVVPASPDERRFAVFDVAESYKGSDSYFAALNAEMEQGGVAAMMHDLLAVDLQGWHPRRDVPDTAALRDQKARSLKPEEMWWVDLLQAGQLPGAEQDPSVAPGNALYEHARRTVPGLKWASDHSLAHFLKQAGCDRPPGGRMNGFRAWRFPPLPEARAAWSRRLPTTWDTPEDDGWTLPSASGDDDGPY